MKSSCLRPLVALLIVASLSACGGKASFDVSGVINGLSNPGLVLENKGDTVSPPAGASSFTFPKRIDYGTEYNITVQTSPAHMNCTINTGSGSAGYYLSIAATVSCVQNSYTVGGTITGLSVAGLELSNGSGAATLLPAAAATTFVFAETVPYGKFYGVTVLTQPPGLTCTVSNGTGTMGEAAVANIAIACVPKV